MSAYEVKDKLVAAINENKYDFIVVNFGNGDMVGHTGIYEAIEKAVVAVDACADMNRANEVRPMFRRLADVAERTGCAVILIGHLNKAA